MSPRTKRYKLDKEKYLEEEMRENRRRISDNGTKILFAIIFFAITVVASFIYLELQRKDDMDYCQAKLYEMITDKQDPIYKKD